VEELEFSSSQAAGRGAAVAAVEPTPCPDLATAMKYNPGPQNSFNGRFYFDLGPTPYYEGWYEMHQPPNPGAASGPHRLSTYYQSGHMVYAHQESLKAIHDGTWPRSSIRLINLGK